MRLIIADDHDLVRDTLALFLAREPDLHVETAEDLPGALSLVSAEAPADLILLDYGMPGMDGMTGLKRALGHEGAKAVALVSGSASKSIAHEALSAGAIGFLPTTMGATSLLNAVRFMAAGETFAPVKFMTDAAEDPQPNSLAQTLTQREQDVLRGLCAGHSNKEIGRALSLQEVTIKLHVKTLCRKLNARNRTQAAIAARDAGFV